MWRGCKIVDLHGWGIIVLLAASPRLEEIAISGIPEPHFDIPLDFIPGLGVDNTGSVKSSQISAQSRIAATSFLQLPPVDRNRIDHIVTQHFYTKFKPLKAEGARGMLLGTA
jgi:hypothetical protein